MNGRIGARLIGIFAIIVVLFIGVSGSIYTIDQGERGVVLRNGAAIGTADPGLHFKLPLFDSVVRIPITQQVSYWVCANSGAANCPAGNRFEMQAYSQDQQPAEMRVTVSWHIPESDVQKVYSDFGSLDAVENRLIARRAPQEVKTVFGRFTAVSVIQDRSKFNDEVQKSIEQSITGPIQIDSVQIENIDFSEAYEKSVEAAMQARVEVQKMQQQEQQQEVQAKITIVKAQAEADAKLAEAKAEAEAIKVRGEAVASAMRARGAALKENPGLVELTQAERWDGHLPTTMVPGTSVPFLNIK